MRITMPGFAHVVETPMSRRQLSNNRAIRFGSGSQNPQGDTFQSTSSSNPDRQLLQAVKDNEPKRVRQHLDEGADSNARDSLFYTALHRAVDQGNLENVDLLLREGANPNAKAPPFQVSAVHKNPQSEEAQRIAQLGGDIATMSPVVQDTPLDRAFHHRKVAVIPALILAGAHYPSDQQSKLEEALKAVYSTQNLPNRLKQAIEDLDGKTAKVLLKIGVKQDKLPFLYGEVLQKAIGSAKTTGPEGDVQRAQRHRKHHQSLQMLRILDPFVADYSYLAQVIAENKATLLPNPAVSQAKNNDQNT